MSRHATVTAQDSHDSQFRDLTYVCAQCGHTQSIRYFHSEAILPVTCCVKCRAGFGIPTSGEMVMRNVGMFPELVTTGA